MMNINFGLSDYGRMKYMLNMAKLLKEKKQKEAELKQGINVARCQQQIAKLQEKARQQLTLMEDYSAKHKQKAVLAYVSFQSEGGKDKFVKAMRGNWCTRCCFPSYYRHK